MAEDRRIIVEVTGTMNVKYSMESSPSSSEIPGSIENVKQKNSSESGAKSSGSAKALALMAAEQATKIVGSMIQNSVNKYFSLSENYLAENDYTRYKTLASKGQSLFQSVATGVATGGPIGGVVAAVLWGGNEFVSYQNRMSGYYQALNATNYQTQFDRSRLGLTNEGKGTEN